MEISKISNIMNPSYIDQKLNVSKSDDPSFGMMLSNAINNINNEQIEGYGAMHGLATGKVENLQEAVKQIGEAEFTLNLALEVKNKALNAYKEVMRMQI